MWKIAIKTVVCVRSVGVHEMFICSVPQMDITADVTNCLVYLDNYIYYAGLSRKVTCFLQL